MAPLELAVVGLGGLEPPTPRLSSVCSNQLSYRPLVDLNRPTAVAFGFLQSDELVWVLAKLAMHVS